MRARKETRTARKAGALSNLRRSRPAFLCQDGKAISVVIDIKRYREMLELLEDLDDLAYLEEMSRKPMKYRPFEEFLAEHEGR
jgi:hypothetical protein